ncbi:hypothetical protein AGMMS49928_14850 [Spirochaetia bacterium]|nr:hypothetical protein AGMMS49928_14850 [Spirochaetia bacterium]
MKKSLVGVKKALVVVVLGFFVLAPAFSGELDDLKGAVKSFSGDLAKSLPFNASLGLNWSDAHIGQFLGLPPHFGVGVSMGFTTMKFDSFNDLMKLFGPAIPDALNWGGVPSPNYTVEGRIGGFILPFDVGFKVGYLPPIDISNTSINSLLLGGDIRYAIFKKGALLPLSVGVGVNYMSGGLSQKIDQAPSFNYEYDGNSYTLSVTDPTVGFVWETFSLDFKAQISGSFLIITPYLGLGASHAWSKAGYEVKAPVNIIGGPAGLESAKDYIDDISDKGFSSIEEVTGWSCRVFGGASFNLAVIRLDFTGLYNFFDGAYGVSFGARFQL